MFFQLGGNWNFRIIVILKNEKYSKLNYSKNLRKNENFEKNQKKRKIWKISENMKILKKIKNLKNVRKYEKFQKFQEKMKFSTRRALRLELRSGSFSPFWMGHFLCSQLWKAGSPGSDGVRQNILVFFITARHEVYVYRGFSCINSFFFEIMKFKPNSEFC